MIFKAPPQFGQCSMSMSNTRSSQARPTHARSIIMALGHPATAATSRCAKRGCLIGCVLGLRLENTG